MFIRLIVAAFVVFACSPRADAAPAARPNFVFILVDDLRVGALSCEGPPFPYAIPGAKTPNIDRLAKEGALFRNNFVSIPLCSPSRSSFLTGQYAHTTKVTTNGNNNELSHQLITFPKLLHDAGYETAFVGKWHMGNDDAPRPGFDKWVSFKGQGQYVDPDINVDGVAKKMTGGYITDILDEHAVEFVKKPHTKPFCLYLAHKAIHGPFTPAERHKDLYSDLEIKRTPNAADTNEGKPALLRPVPGKAAVAKGKGKAAGGQGSGDQLIRNQLRCLAAIDEGVGQLYQALEETKQLDNTLIIFTSDNGFFWGEHKLGDKRWAYEESIRIPQIARYPKLIKPGVKIDAMTLNIDIAPTLLDLAGAPIPKNVHGKSMVSLFKGQTRNWRKSFLTEYFFEQGFPRTPTWHAARNERWKYVHYDELEGMDELYDLKNDPYEMKNLINEPGSATALSAMKAELERLLKETS